MKHVEEEKKCFNGGESSGKKQTVLQLFPKTKKCSPARAIEITKLITEMAAQDLCPLSSQLLNFIEPGYDTYMVGEAAFLIEGESASEAKNDQVKSPNND